MRIKNNVAAATTTYDKSPCPRCGQVGAGCVLFADGLLGCEGPGEDVPGWRFVGGQGAFHTKSAGPEAPALAVVPASGLERGSPADWLWHGLLARGSVTLLSAIYKAGKSTLLAHLLRTMGRGGDFWGQVVKPGRALVITEESATKWAARRDDLGIGDNSSFIVRPFGAKPGMAAWLSFVRKLEEVQAREHFDLLVFDTLANLWPVKNENDNGEQAEALLPLQSLAEGDGKKRAAVLLIHHFRKSDAAAASPRFTGARGGGFLGGFANILLELRWFDDLENEADRRRVLRGAGHFDETPRELVAELRDDGYCLLKGDKSEVVRSVLLDLIETVLRHHFTEWELNPDPAKPAYGGMETLEISSDLPEGKCPNRAKLLAALRKGVQGGRWRREGGGKKGDPHRYLIVAPHDGGTGDEPPPPGADDVQHVLDEWKD